MRPLMPLFRTISLGLLLLSGCGGSTAMNVVDARPGSEPGAPEVSPGRADAVNDTAVAADLPTEMPRGLCGNSKLDPGEGCDDGNAASGDGCSSTCKLECDWCPGCPPGQCVIRARCGNGRVTGDEVCDDGNTTSGDGCAEDCGAVEPGWRCRAPGRLCTPICGDKMRVGGETCDDGNTSDRDGCSAYCLTEPGWDCSSGPCVPVASLDGGIDAGPAQARCGDGILSGAEECDLGNRNDDTAYGGCTTTCAWGPFCGDGMVNGPEACDFGNRTGSVSGKDGCTAVCTTPHYCGDGIVDTALGEECDLGELNGVSVDRSNPPREDVNGEVTCTTECRLVWIDHLAVPPLPIKRTSSANPSRSILVRSAERVPGT
jgi:cysteine-rich repeat protein